MTKFWLILRMPEQQLVARPAISDRASALAAAAKLAAQEIESRFVVLEAVACTTEPAVSVSTKDL